MSAFQTSLTCIRRDIALSCVPFVGLYFQTQVGDTIHYSQMRVRPEAVSSKEIEEFVKQFLSENPLDNPESLSNVEPVLRVAAKQVLRHQKLKLMMDKGASVNQFKHRIILVSQLLAAITSVALSILLPGAFLYCLFMVGTFAHITALVLQMRAAWKRTQTMLGSKQLIEYQIHLMQQTVLEQNYEDAALGEEEAASKAFSCNFDEKVRLEGVAVQARRYATVLKTKIDAVQDLLSRSI